MQVLPGLSCMQWREELDGMYDGMHLDVCSAPCLVSHIHDAGHGCNCCPA